MVGAGAEVELRTTPTGWSCSINGCLLHRVSSENRNREGHETNSSVTLPRGLCRFRRRGAQPRQMRSSALPSNLRTDGIQAARTNPLVSRSRNQSWSTLRRSMSVG
jgi:hypothetical protein